MNIFNARCRLEVSGILRRSQWRARLTGLGAMAFVAAAPAGFAQEAGNAPTDQQTQTLQTVVVTAEKREGTVQSTPLSITAYSGADLVANGVTDISAVAQQTPGVSMRNTGPGQVEYEMRGISSSGGTSPTTGFYLDETPITPPADGQTGKVAIDPSLYDLARVEVLRGPQGTLYGAGSMGGTIRLITNQPDTKAFAASGEAIFSDTPAGGFNQGYNVMGNIPLLTDFAALRIVATDKYTSGWIDRVVEDNFPLPTGGGMVRGDVLGTPESQRFTKVNNERLKGARASLLVTPTSRLSLDFSFLYQGITQGGQNLVDVPPGVDYEAHYEPYSIPEPYSDSFELLSFVGKYAWDPAELTVAVSHYRRNSFETQDSTEPTQNFMLNVIGVTDPGSDNLAYSNIGLFATYAADWTTQTTEEVRLASSGSSPFQWLVGGFHQTYKAIDNVYTNDPTGSLINSIFGTTTLYDINIIAPQSQYALFGEVSYELPQHLKFTAGARYYHASQDSIVGGSGGLVNGSDTMTYSSTSSRETGTNPKANISWRPTNDLTVYAEAAKGFRMGGGNGVAPTGCPVNPLSYQSDGLWSYELGEKAQLLDHHLSINASGYYEKWTGIQQSIAEPCGNSYTGNAGAANIYGAELELAALLTSHWTLSSSTGATHAEISDSVPGSGFYVGEKVQNVPSWTNTTSLEFHTPFGNNDYSFLARLQNVYVGPQTTLGYALYNMAGTDTVNLRTGVLKGGLSVMLFVDNLADQRQILGYAQQFSFAVPTYNRAATNQPRTIGVDVHYEFRGL